MTLKQVSARVDPVQLRRARKALAASTTSKTLALVAEKAAHDRVIRRYDRVGTPDAFREE